MRVLSHALADLCALINRATHLRILMPDVTVSQAHCCEERVLQVLRHLTHLYRSRARSVLSLLVQLYWECADVSTTRAVTDLLVRWQQTDTPREEMDISVGRPGRSSESVPVIWTTCRRVLIRRVVMSTVLQARAVLGPPLLSLEEIIGLCRPVTKADDTALP